MHLSSFSVSNAARRKNGTGGGFLSLWLLADVLNISETRRVTRSAREHSLSLFVRSLPRSRAFLPRECAFDSTLPRILVPNRGCALLTSRAFLSSSLTVCPAMTADIFLGIELCLWGHPGRVSPNPTPAATLIKRLDMEHKHQWIARFDRQFADWSLWDNAKLVMSCIFLGFSWWVRSGVNAQPSGRVLTDYRAHQGLYVVNMLYLKQGDFEIEIPTDHSAKAIGPSSRTSIPSCSCGGLTFVGAI